ncbi:MAG: DUF3099 domain-containing protein [Actinobacteria bacterium]|nr:DUF3099 domain-containing protein [Actinomycetota bacterium]MCA1720810.1 DUF3099 domain-containing protein [Actinomycetota bacterium]
MQSPDRTVITTAGRSRTEDMRLRTRRYLITQGVRVACVLLAVLLPVDPIWKIGFIAGSIVLPWFGVVAANAGPAVDRTRATVLVDRAEPLPLPALPPGRVIDAD